jgi:hypothetical protein
MSWRDAGTAASCSRLPSTCRGVHKSSGSVQAVLSLWAERPSMRTAKRWSKVGLC